MTHLDARYARVGRAYDALDDANVRLDTGSASASASTTRYPQRYVGGDNDSFIFGPFAFPTISVTSFSLSFAWQQGGDLRMHDMKVR